MKRRLFWVSVLATAFVVLAGAWFLSQFEQVPVNIWTPPGLEARRNPYLALERFLLAMGRPLTRADDALSLDHLVPGGVVLLDRRRAYMTPERLEHLLAWVNAGGYLMAVPELPGVDDPILRFFKVNCACRSEEDEAAEDETAGDETAGNETAEASPDEAPNASPDKTPEKPRDAQNEALDALEEPKSDPNFTVKLPGAPPLKILGMEGPEMKPTPGEMAPLWKAGTPELPNQVLHFQHGQGNVTLLTEFSNFRNPLIGEHDHAEFLWTLLETHQPRHTGPIILMTQVQDRGLRAWLLGPAQRALIALLALVVLWLWSVVPRFGQAVPEPEGGRRQLSEHLSALGRYVWQRGGGAHWLEIARAAFLARLALSHPDLAALAPQEQARALSQLTGYSLHLVASALHLPADSPSAFTLALRTLHNLERTL